MFKSKYIFETRQTKFLRYCKSGLVFIAGLCFLYLVSGYFFVLLSQNENNKALETFFRSRPDLIVVFTGSRGRIPYAMKLAKDFKQSHVFITGVYSRNSVDTLLTPLKLEGQVDSNLLEIDYYARNTVENSIATLRYLRQNKGFKRILVVSHDYHILRIKTILSNIRTSRDEFKFYYSGVKSDYSKLSNIKRLYKEVFKLIRTAAFLVVYHTDSDISHSD